MSWEKTQVRAGEMAQEIKELAIKSDDLEFHPQYPQERSDSFLWVVLSHVLCGTKRNKYTHMHINK